MRSDRPNAPPVDRRAELRPRYRGLLLERDPISAGCIAGTPRPGFPGAFGRCAIGAAHVRRGMSPLAATGACDSTRIDRQRAVQPVPADSRQLTADFVPRDTEPRPESAK